MDTLAPCDRSERMARIGPKGSKPEMLIRRLVHGMGYRYHLHRRDLPGKPDLVFPRRRKIIFVHGCFWHRHPDPTCNLARLPKSRQDFWVPKLGGNRARDLASIERLQALGWNVLVIWECGLKRASLASEIREFLDS